MKTLPFIIFAVAALAQWAAPLSQIWSHEQTLAKGTLIRLKCGAPDPYDPLRGRYLAVSPEQREASVPPGLELTHGMQVYGVLSNDADGLSVISSISLTPPTSSSYLRLKVGYELGNPEDDKIGIEWPFERFYINEKLAPEADKWFAENLRNAKGIIAEVRVLHGRAVLADLTLDGKPFREILKERVGEARH